MKKLFGKRGQGFRAYGNRMRGLSIDAVDACGYHNIRIVLDRKFSIEIIIQRGQQSLPHAVLMDFPE